MNTSFEHVPKPYGLGGVVIFQGFAVMERLGTPQKQKRILEYCSPPPPPLSEEDVVKKRAAEAQKQQEARAAREKKEQERAAKFEELKSLQEKWGFRSRTFGTSKLNAFRTTKGGA